MASNHQGLIREVVLIVIGLFLLEFVFDLGVYELIARLVESVLGYLS